MILDPITGLINSIEYYPSPNHGERPDGIAISLLVIHNISLPPGQFGGSDVIAFFTNTLDCSLHPYFGHLEGLCVSSHFFIRRTGQIIQFVPTHQRAWHAGQSSWKGKENCNDYSIGIELEGIDDLPYTDKQYLSLSALACLLKAHYPIDDYAGHSDIAPGRKTDPGPAFNWEHFYQMIA